MVGDYVPYGPVGLELLQARTFLTEWLPSSANPAILLFNIVSRFTFRIVVVNVLQNRMPRIDFCHYLFLC